MYTVYEETEINLIRISVLLRRDFESVQSSLHYSRNIFDLHALYYLAYLRHYFSST